jgi:hypothetical protein
MYLHLFTFYSFSLQDADALKKMKQCEKEVRAEAFNKAIESEGGGSGW